MEVLYARCCGIDVHKESLVACLRVQDGRRKRTEVQSFGTTTAEILRLHAWLSEAQCTHVGIAYASHCTSLGRCETFSGARPSLR
jgi:transposase